MRSFFLSFFLLSFPPPFLPSPVATFVSQFPRSFAPLYRRTLLHSGSRSLLFRLRHLSLALLCVAVRYVAFCCVAAFDFIAFSVLARALANERRHGSHCSIAACTPAPGHAPSPLLPMILLKKPSRHDRRRSVIATLLGFDPPDEQPSTKASLHRSTSVDATPTGFAREAWTIDASELLGPFSVNDH